MDRLIDTLTITHNGGADELTYAWDSEQMLLTLGGFRTYDGSLTYVRVTHSLLDEPTLFISNDLVITEYMDSNDIADEIITYLTGAITPLIAETVSEVPAAVNNSFTLDVWWYNFIAATIACNIVNDGNCSVTRTETITATPLAQVSGISSARGRLLAWDMLNAIYRSALLDVMDFTPSLATQANVGKAQAVRGNIILITGNSEGYTVYSTDNIVEARYTGDEYLFKYSETAHIGLADPRHLAIGMNAHVMYTTAGLRVLDVFAGKISEIDTEVDTYLTRYPWPLKLTMCADRYLVISLPFLLEEDRTLRANRALAAGVPMAAIPTPANLVVPNPEANRATYTSYARHLVLDRKLKKWGSCDTGAQGIFGCTVVNAAGIDFAKLGGNQDSYLGLEGVGLGIISATNGISLASRHPTSSLVQFGQYRTQAYGWSMLVELMENIRSLTVGTHTYTVVAHGKDGAVIQNATWTGTLPTAQPRLAGVYFNLYLQGVYDITQLRIAGYTQTKL